MKNAKALIGSMLLAILFIPGFVQAAEIVVSSYNSVTIGQEVAVDIILRADEIEVNAFGGEVRVEGGEVSGINEAISDIGLWLESPKVKEGVVAWSGITTGGRTGDIRMFRLYVRVLESEVKVLVDNVEVYEHDGNATEVPIAPTVYTIDAVVRAEPPSPASSEKWDDTWPPEPFNIDVSYDSTLFEEAPVLLFTTTDKQSGLARYEVAIDDGEFAEAASPFEFIEGITRARVKAIDRAGNEQVSEIYFEKQSGQIPFSLIALAIGAIICLLTIYAVFPRR